MKVSGSHEVPHQRLRPFLDFWNELRGDRSWPSRSDISLDQLRGAASNVAFCRIERPFRDLDSLRLVNVGSAIERATGRDLTGLTIGQVVDAFGSSPEFTRCFAEYGVVAVEGCCTYNEGVFPWPNQNWLAYRRLVMPLGSGAEPEGLFIVFDLNAVGLGLTVPSTLKARAVAQSVPAKPWAAAPLQMPPGSGLAARDEPR